MSTKFPLYKGNVVKSRIRELFIELEEQRQHQVILYHGTLHNDASAPLYELIRNLKSGTRSVDLVLSCPGGLVNSARRIALLLHQYVDNLNILVPFRARSAGTLLCLAAHELIMTTVAELGPIDTHISAQGVVPPDSPQLISAEEILAFRELSEKWFQISGEEEKFKVFALLAQRIFPTTLGDFYRARQLIHQTANELIAYQLPNVDQQRREQIVTQLISGYYSHDYPITREDAQALGLRVKFASDQEEDVMWNIYKLGIELINSEVDIPMLIMSRDYIAVKSQEEIMHSTNGQEVPSKQMFKFKESWELQRIEE